MSADEYKSSHPITVGPLSIAITFLLLEVFLGLFAAFLSTFFITAKDVLSKKLASRVDGTVSAFASFLFAIPYYLIVLLVMYLLGYETFDVKEGFFLFILARGLSDTCAEWLKMLALGEADLSLIMSFLSLYPILLLFVSPIITGDPISASAIYSTICIVIGTIILVYRPRGKSHLAKLPWKGIFLAVGAAIFFSLNTSLDRMAAQTGPPIFSGFMMTLIAGVMLSVPAMRKVGWREGLRSNYKLFTARGFFEAVFMSTKLWALSSLSAPYVVAIQRLSLLFSIISGRYLLQEEDFLRRFVAGVFICSGVVWMVLAG